MCLRFMFECQKKTYTPVLSISSLFPNICSANWKQKSQLMKERQLCYRKVRRISSECLINSRQERCRQGAPRSPWNTKNFPIFRPTKTQMNSPKMTTRTILFCDIPWPKRREKKSKSWCEYLWKLNDCVNCVLLFILMNLQKKFYYRQRQADRNRAKVLERLEKRKQKGGTDRRTNSTKNTPQLSQEECLENLRKFVGMAPIAGIQKQTLVNITKVTFLMSISKLSTYYVHYLNFP